MVQITRSRFAETFFQLRGQPFRFVCPGTRQNRRWLTPIFNSNARKTLLYTGRQVSKSTSQSGVILADSACIPHFRTTYVTPTGQQVQVFSSQRMAPMIHDSPRFRHFFWDSNCVSQVRNRSLKNRSHITMGSAFHTADSLRGISSDRLCIDEVQDILAESIKVLEETTSASDYKYFLYSGTPKTRSHAIDSYWRASSQNVWAVPCEGGCGRWNFPLGEENIKAEGLSCRFCGHPIDVMNGEWVVQHRDAEWQGWHISQLMCPWIPWEDIWSKYQGPTAYHIGTFYNEVLGFSYDLGLKPITAEDIQRCCDALYSMLDPERRRLPLAVAGLDWALQSPDISRAPSFTILTIAGWDNDRFRVFDVKKYQGYESDPESQVSDIVARCQKAGVKLLCCDWGVGHKENQRIRQAMGRLDGKDKVLEVRYVDQRAKVRWDAEAGCLAVNRTRSLDDLFSAFKQKKEIWLPTWREISPYAKDILGVFSDPGTNRFRREYRYDHSPEDPDDWMHSLNYAYIAGRYLVGRIREEEA